MATVSEVLRIVSCDLVVLAGAAGLGREVRRVLLVRPPFDLMASVNRDDLVVYDTAGVNSDAHDAADRAITALANAGIAGIVTDRAPTAIALQAADKLRSPLISSSDATELERLHGLLVRALDQHQEALGLLQVKLQLDLARLVRAGATPAMLLERLVEKTSKTGLLQLIETGDEFIRQPALHDLGTESIRRAVKKSHAVAERWITETADATAANVLYLELPAERLVRLVAPVWIDERVWAAVSLFANSDGLGGRDRVALVGVARAIALAYANVPLQIGPSM
jgi:hypothetical protein